MNLTKRNIYRTNPKNDGSLKNNYLCPRYGVSVDHFKSRLKGRTYTSFGKTTSKQYVEDCRFLMS